MKDKIRKEIDRAYRRLKLSQENIYARLDAQRIARLPHPRLFIDAGANVGQGFKWFSKALEGVNISFELLEPNPNCQSILQRVAMASERDVTIIPSAIGVSAGRTKFYGLAEQEGGAFSQGGSILREHNSISYNAADNNAIEVEVCDACDFLQERSKRFKTIIMKMDIEGAELDVLEHLLDSGSARLINTLYVEFHSQYQVSDRKEILKAREIKVLKSLRDCGIKVRLWH